jgi:hypothetical protein
MPRRTNTRIRPALALLTALLLAGCSKSLLTAPDPATTNVPVVENARQAPQPPSLLGGALPIVDQLLNWVTVVTKLVRKDQEMVVTGHRWSLEFEKGSLSADATITIQDYDPNVLDVQFGPHGTQFPVPVTLSIDFANTDADPGAAHYNGREPALYWLNEHTNTWDEVPGRVDWLRKKLIVKLPHFSRYVVGTKAGWKHQPQRQDD